MAFRPVPALRALAPTESEPPFQQTQLVVLVLFVLFGNIVVRLPEARSIGRIEGHNRLRFCLLFAPTSNIRRLTSEF
jgi:hypothetical protein